MTSPKDATSSQAATNSKRVVNRRRVITLAGAGTAAVFSQLPGSWTKPVVDAVLLPAHAQASPPPSSGASSSTSSTSSSGSTGSPAGGSSGSTSSSSTSSTSSSGASSSSTSGSSSSSSSGGGGNICNGEKGLIEPIIPGFDFTTDGQIFNSGLSNPTAFEVTAITAVIEGPNADKFQIVSIPSTLSAGTTFTQFSVQWNPGAGCGGTDKASAVLRFTGTSCGETVQGLFALHASCHDL